MRFFKVLFLFLLLSLPAAAQEEGVFNAETFTLGNGMQVVLIPNDRAPVVTHMLWIKAGAADEPPGKSGIAHFLEHLMFKGTPEIGPGEFSKRVRSLGGNDNAFTSQDATAYFQTIARDRLRTVMKMEADRFMNLSPPEDEVLSERNVILEERSQRMENSPQALFSEALHAVLYVNHPYGVPIIGWRNEMETLSWADAQAFRQKYYTPSNAVLIVSGDVTMEELRPLAEEIYGAIPAGESVTRQRTEAPELAGENRIILRHEAVRQPEFRRLIMGTSFRESEEEAYALQVLNEALSGGPTTRIYKTLVKDRKVATNAGMYARLSALDTSEIGLYASPADGVTLDELEKAYDDLLKQIIADGLTEDELELAKKRLIADAVYARDSLSGPARIIGHALATGSTLEDVEIWPQRIEDVTLEQVNQVAGKYLDPDSDRRSVTGYLIPEEADNEQVSAQ